MGRGCGCRREPQWRETRRSRPAITNERDESAASSQLSDEVRAVLRAIADHRHRHSKEEKRGGERKGYYMYADKGSNEWPIFL